MTLKGKTVSADIEVVDAPLDYNLLLGRSWFYAMTYVVSIVFCVLQFPHQGKIIIVDQMDYITPNLHNVATNDIPFLGQSSFESVGVGLFKDSSLKGVFPLPSLSIPHVSTLNMILTQVQKHIELSDPLVVHGLTSIVHCLCQAP
jgi:hypothetical protein